MDNKKMPRPLLQDVILLSKIKNIEKALGIDFPMLFIWCYTLYKIRRYFLIVFDKNI